MNVSEDDKNRGLYDKFKVRRSDGRDQPGEKHDGCQYFVLDLDHDPFALEALRTYARECRKTHPKLARDLLRFLLDKRREGS